MARPLVYISGPIAKPSRKRGRYGKNIVPAMDAWYELHQLGYAPQCPHLSYFLDNYIQKTYDHELTHAEWMSHDYELVKVCQAVLRLPGESKGADLEVTYAKAHKIPVFENIDDLHSYFTTPCTCLGCRGELVL